MTAFSYLMYVLMFCTVSLVVLPASSDDIFFNYTLVNNCNIDTDILECLNTGFIWVRSTNSVVTLRLNFKEQNFSFQLNAVEPSIFTSDSQIFTENNDTVLGKKDFENLPIYDGLDANGTYACGYILDNFFTGFLMRDDGSGIFIESLSQFNRTVSNESLAQLAYASSDIMYGDCLQFNGSEECVEKDFLESLYCKRVKMKKIWCYLNASDSSRIPWLHFANDYSDMKTKDPHLYSTVNATCSVSLTLDRDFCASYDNNLQHAIIHLALVLKYSNWILSSMDFDGDGRKDGLSLRIRTVTLADFNELTAEKDELLPEIIQYFREVPQDNCLSLGFLSLPTTKNFLSMAYGGGVCKNNGNEPELARNIAVINNADASGLNNPLFITARMTLMAIGQVMGSTEMSCSPNAVYPSEDNHTSFFSECSKYNMAKVLQSSGSCLKFPGEEKRTFSPQKPVPNENISLCGNGKVDAGEECDCGSKDRCKIKDNCCVPPGEKLECHYNRAMGYECDWTEDCCTQECRIVPKSWKQFCGTGDASCVPVGAYCNGVGSHCPVPQSASRLRDGDVCGPASLRHFGAATCRGGRCNSTICADAGLQDCVCSVASRMECRVCCRRTTRNSLSTDSELCVPAEYFGLKPKKETDFYRYPGTTCNEMRLGHCTAHGVCVQHRAFSSAEPILVCTRPSQFTNMLCYSLLYFILVII